MASDSTRFEHDEGCRVSERSLDDVVNQGGCDPTETSVREVMKHDIRDAETLRRGRQFVVAKPAEMMDGAEGARLTMGEAHDAHVGAGCDESGEDRAQPEALVVGMGDHRQRRPAASDLADGRRVDGGAIDHQDAAATGFTAVGTSANS